MACNSAHALQSTLCTCMQASSYATRFISGRCDVGQYFSEPVIGTTSQLVSVISNHVKQARIRWITLDPLGSVLSYFCIAYSRPLLPGLFLFTSHFETLRARMRLLQQFKHGRYTSSSGGMKCGMYSLTFPFDCQKWPLLKGTKG